MIASHLIFSNKRPLTILIVRRYTTSRSLLDNLWLICWVRRMSSHTSIAWQVALIVIVVLLIFSEWIWWTVLVNSANSNWCPSVINIIACIACIDSSREIHSVGSTTSYRCKSAAHSVIILPSRILIILRRRCWIIILMMSGRILCTVLIAMANDFFGLIIESRVLRCRVIFETIWPEQNLIPTLIVILCRRPGISSVW